MTDAGLAAGILPTASASPPDTAPRDTARPAASRSGDGPPDADAPDDTAAVVAPAPRQASLSPSRAADFKTCPLLYRFRSIDRIPEQATQEQARGTLVHAVLEHLFDLPAEQRTPQRAADLIEPQWDRLVAEQDNLADLFPDPGGDTGPSGSPGPADDSGPDSGPVDSAGPDSGTGPESSADPGGADPDSGAGPRGGTDPGGGAATRAEFLDSARDLLRGYFAVEDPRRLEPAQREYLVTTWIDEGRLLLRGYIDRLDIAPDGATRVVDYKTGGAPREAFEARALFQLKFYALVLWRTRGVAPRALRLLYLKDAEICDYHPDTDELQRFERTLVALWAAIEKATAAHDFRPQPSRLCAWCAHQALCPAYGGTPPPFPTLTALPAPTVRAPTVG